MKTASGIMPEAVLYYRRYVMNRRILTAAVSAVLMILSTG